MSTIIKITILMLTAVFSAVGAQEFQGMATYRTQRKVDIKLDSTQVNSDLQKQLMAMMKKKFQKTFKLSFNREASVYKEEESLGAPQMGGGLQIQMIGAGGGTDILYKNTKEKRYSDQKDTMGKIFLVKDSLKPINWQLGSETKFIGKYQCYKATYTKQVRELKNISFNNTTNSDEGKDTGKLEPQMKDRSVTAWYTPEIPVNSGPAMYQGLPGLILEVHDGKLNIICSKIIINPVDSVEIKEPTKGKLVDAKTYEQIMENKVKEMQERYAPRGGRDGERIEIRIGG